MKLLYVSFAAVDCLLSRHATGHRQNLCSSLVLVFNCMTLFQRLNFISVVVSATKKLSSYFSELIDDMLFFNSQNFKNSVDDVISVVKTNIHLFFIFMFVQNLHCGHGKLSLYFTIDN